MTPTFRVGVDIGGTFTDLVVYNPATGALTFGKTLTTPADPAQAITSGLAETLPRAGATLAEVAQIIHGTTLVTNAIIERRGAATALLATAGFRDTTEIGREHRYDLYDLQIELPQPLVPRELRFDVPERTLADGSIYQDLDVAYVERLARELVANDVAALAIAFLNSYANPAHEHAARAAVLRVAPGLRIAISSEVVPEIREFERTSTTVANVYVQGRVEDYLRTLETDLAQGGFGGALLLMLSSGGLGTVETAVRFPVRLLESGPAAGALAAASFGAAAGHADLLSFDMGGTTAKFAVIEHGAPLIAHEFEVDRRYRFKKGSGLPIKTPVVEMIEIGAGGGSIASVNSLGLLKVGPTSAGATPGPVCYGRGGALPTVTDADLVLGYLNPAFFLGGGMALDIDGARAAIATHIAQPLGLSIADAAWGIHQIVNETMASAARVHTIERGKDPRGLPVYAFGGAGPVHGFRVAQALAAGLLVVPTGAGVMSAVGFLGAPVAFDFVRSLPGQLATLDWARVDALLDEMRAEGTTLLVASGVPAHEITTRSVADVRYVGQGHEVRVPIPAAAGDRAAGLRAAFETEYTRVYGRLGPPVPLEVLTWRVTCAGLPPILTQQPNIVRGEASAAQKGERPIYLPEQGGMTPVPVYDRYQLAAGTQVAGPAVIEERESTLIVGPGGTCTVDTRGNLVVDIGTP